MEELVMEELVMEGPVMEGLVTQELVTERRAAEERVCRTESRGSMPRIREFGECFVRRTAIFVPRERQIAHSSLNFFPSFKGASRCC